MHKVMNNFYLKSLLRALKETKLYNKVYNESSLKEIIDNIYDKAKDDPCFPHILPNVLFDIYDKNRDILRKKYLDIILSKYIKDLTILIKTEGKGEKIINNEILIKKITENFLYSHLRIYGVKYNDLYELQHKYFYNV